MWGDCSRVESEMQCSRVLYSIQMQSQHLISKVWHVVNTLEMGIKIICAQDLKNVIVFSSSIFFIHTMTLTISSGKPINGLIYPLAHLSTGLPLSQHYDCWLRSITNEKPRQCSVGNGQHMKGQLKNIRRTGLKPQSPSSEDEPGFSCMSDKERNSPFLTFSMCNNTMLCCTNSETSNQNKHGHDLI